MYQRGKIYVSSQSPYLVALVSWARAEAAVDQLDTVLLLGLIGLKIGMMEADITVELTTASRHLGTFIFCFLPQ
jgi:hypothetical protein